MCFFFIFNSTITTNCVNAPMHISSFSTDLKRLLIILQISWSHLFVRSNRSYDEDVHVWRYLGLHPGIVQSDRWVAVCCWHCTRRQARAVRSTFRLLPSIIAQSLPDLARGRSQTGRRSPTRASVATIRYVSPNTHARFQNEVAARRRGLFFLLLPSNKLPCKLIYLTQFWTAMCMNMAEISNRLSK